MAPLPAGTNPQEPHSKPSSMGTRLPNYGTNSRRHSSAISTPSTRSEPPLLWKDPNFRDPDIEPRLPCAGGVLYMKTFENSGYAVDQWSTNRMGKLRGKPIRDLGWGHPVVVLSWETDEHGNLFFFIANITSFGKTSFDDYLRRCGDYANGKNVGESIKWANTLPIFQTADSYSQDQVDKAKFLYTTGARMSKQSYVAMEGVYKVPWKFLRAYGMRYPDSWSVRFDEDSYYYLMKELRVQPRAYEQLQDLINRKATLEAEGVVGAATRGFSENPTETSMTTNESMKLPTRMNATLPMTMASSSDESSSITTSVTMRGKASGIKVPAKSEGVPGPVSGLANQFDSLNTGTSSSKSACPLADLTSSDISLQSPIGNSSLNASAPVFRPGLPQPPKSPHHRRENVPRYVLGHKQ